MASSLFQTKKLSNQSNIISLIKGNPVQALTGILQKNPQMKNMLDVMVKGKDPKEVFYQKCSEMGYDPEDILKLIR
nr:MAG TPA: hypothetical protein [Caudoviricetes sp.]